VWVAYDEGLFREQGLDVELVNVPGTAQVIQAMIAGEIHVSHLDPTSAIRATLEGADLALVLGVNNRFANQILSQPAIPDAAALRGKTLGIGRLGGTYHSAALVALREWQLVPDRDVTLRQFAETSAIIAGLDTGQVDAGLVTVPVPRPVQARYHLLFDLTTQGPEYPSVGMGGPRPWVQANEDAMRRFVRAYVLGDRRTRGDKAAALAAFRKYMRLDDAELLEDRYASYSTLVPAVPTISEAGFALLLQDLTAEEPRLASYQVGDFVDLRFVRELETTGFFR
jgi:NitT/TauT family transport system substrate-binding protein